MLHSSQEGSDIVATRFGSAGDHGQVGIALRRSTDRGLTFLPRQDVWRETNHTIGNPAPIWNSRTGEVVLLFSRDNKEVWVMSSKTRGRSWSKPRNISAATVPYAEDWEWVATGPGGGVQIERGPHAGRLVQCCDHMQCSSRGGCKDVTVQEPWNFSHKGSHTIFSDNDGLHWQLGAVVGNGGEVWGGECSVAMQPSTDGKHDRLVMAIERDKGADFAGQDRAFAVSTSGGASFESLQWNDTVRAPTLISAAQSRLEGPTKILHWPAGRDDLGLRGEHGRSEGWSLPHARSGWPRQSDSVASAGLRPEARVVRPPLEEAADAVRGLGSSGGARGGLLLAGC